MSEATYFGITVVVVLVLEHYALIRRLDGLSCIVAVEDLEVSHS